MKKMSNSLIFCGGILFTISFLMICSFTFIPVNLFTITTIVYNILFVVSIVLILIGIIKDKKFAKKIFTKKFAVFLVIMLLLAAVLTGIIDEVIFSREYGLEFNFSSYIYYNTIFNRYFVLFVCALFYSIFGFKQKNVVNEAKKKNKLTKWYVLACIGLLPVLFLLVVSISSYFSGFSFMFSTIYGMQAVIDTFRIVGFLISPFIIIGLIIFAIALFKIINIKRKK